MAGKVASMELRLMAAVTGSLEGVNVAGLCRQVGVSRKTFYKWRARYAAEGLVGLDERTRRPRRSPQRVSLEVEEAVVGWRKWLVGEGLDGGAATIRWHLVANGEPAPAEATIWRILARRGFVTPAPAKRPRRSYRRFEAAGPNERWQADYTCWDLRGGGQAQILNVIDDYSRLAVTCVAATGLTSHGVCQHFTAAARRWGLPASCLSDNGLVFSGKLHGFQVPFETYLHQAGITPITSRPYHPQTCGKVERFQQTLKQWLAARHPQPATIDQLQAALNRFCDYYNFRRPHRGIGRVTPITRWNATTAHQPAPNPLPGPGAHHHHATVNPHGHINLRRWLIPLGRAATTLAGQHADVLIDTNHHAAIWVNGQLTRTLTINPTRRYQPLHPSTP